ncbi:MAG: hypothetical protein Ta2G_15560 [Termitinemataceae bacterium]|nr:MAG: hypothetical protein Ta2G_15560 [Termitinemataceae bacterium]
MFVREIKKNVTELHGIGKTTAALFAKQGIISVSDLLCYYPRRYDDRSITVPLSKFQNGKVCNVFQVLHHEWFGSGRLRTLKVHIQDETGSAVLLCFNRAFLEHKLLVGKSYFIYGSFFYKYGELQCSAFEFEDAENKKSFQTILPIYALCGGLANSTVFKAVKTALQQYASSLEDELPKHIIEQYHLLSKTQALQEIHFPTSMILCEKARKTIIYEELFYMEIIVGKRSMDRKKIHGGGGAPLASNLRFYATPPVGFHPTTPRRFSWPFTTAPCRAPAFRLDPRSIKGGCRNKCRHGKRLFHVAFTARRCR